MKIFATCMGSILMCLILPACIAHGSPTPNEADESKSSAPAEQSSQTGQATPAQANKSRTDDLKSFAANGEKILDSKTGNLTGNGATDVVLVLDPPGGKDDKLGEGSPRRVLLLTRDDSGQLRKAAQNDTIVPCAQCGGIAGDPYSYTRIANGQFTIVTEGGSREHWSNEYTFAYAPEQKDWLLHEVKREVSDQDTGKKKSLDLLPRDFGVVTFNTFDPATLPKAELP